MSSYQARAPSGPTGHAQFGPTSAYHANNQHNSAQQVYEQQFRQQQQQQHAYLQQLQLQNQLLIQQQMAFQQQAQLRAALAAGNQFHPQQAYNHNTQINQHQQHQQHQQQQQRHQQQQDRQQYHARSEHRSPIRSVSATRAGDSRAADSSRQPNALVASALARQAKRQIINSKLTHSTGNHSAVDDARADLIVSPHHSRSSSGHSSNQGGSPEPPALILSRPGDRFPDTSGSETSSDGGLDGEINLLAEENDEQNKRNKLAASFSELSVRNASPPGRASQASSLAAALAGRNNRQRPASLGLGLGHPPVQAQYDQHRAVSDTTNLSVYAASFVPLPPSPFPGQISFTSPPVAHSASFSSNSNNALSRGKAPIKGGASAKRQPKGPAVGAGSNFAQRLRRAAVAQLACVDRAARLV